MSETISVVVASDTKSMGKAAEIAGRVAQVSIEMMSDSLSDMISKLSRVAAVAVREATQVGDLTFKELEVGLEVTAEGGVRLIGSASLGGTASLKLTFVRKE